MDATVKVSAQDEVDTVVVFAVDEIVRAVLGEDDVHTVVVERVRRVIGAVLADDEVHAVVVAGVDGVVGAVLRECGDRRDGGSGRGGFSTCCGGSAGGNEGERRKDCGKKGCSAVHERLRELWLGRSPRHPLRTSHASALPALRFHSKYVSAKKISNRHGFHQLLRPDCAWGISPTKWWACPRARTSRLQFAAKQ